MPGGASVFSSKPLLPVNEENSTKKQTQRLISSSYSTATHSSKVRTLGESTLGFRAAEIQKFSEVTLTTSTEKDSKKEHKVNT